MRCSRFVCLLLCVSAVAAAEQDFSGWQSMEVIKLDDARATRGPLQTSDAVIRLGDINGDGRRNIIAIKRRHSMLSWYAYVPADQRQPPAPIQVNQVPLSPRLQEHEIRFERLPRDMIVLGAGRIAVLVGPPERLEIYQMNKEQDWELQQKIALLPGEPVRHLQMLHLPEQQQVLVATDGGIQQLQLEPELQVSWLRPRDDATPWRWFLSDLDGDGDRDLIASYSSGMEALVWRRNESGFRPPQSIYEQNIRDAVVLDRGDAASDVIMIDAIGDALLRRYRLQAGEAQRFGQRRALGLPDQQSPWLGVHLGERRVLVTYDARHPQLLVYPFADNDWQAATSFPCIDNIEAMIAPQAQPGVILLKRKDDSELYRSQWVNGRFSYPQPWQPQVQEVESDNHQLLQIGSVPGFSWWTQKQGDDVVLFRWADDAEAPQQFRFPGQGKKIEHAIWLGGERLLAKDSFKRDGRILSMVDGEAQVEHGAHLKNMNIAEYRAQLHPEGGIVAARLSGGVLRWLDERLHAIDQIMLEDGLRIDDYAIIDGRQFVLQADSRLLISLKEDDAGVMRGDQRYEIPGGFELRFDPVLGLCVVEPGWVCRLDRGQAWTLQAVEHIDERTAQAVGVDEQRYNRLFAVNVDGAAQEAFIVTDDRRHRLSLFNCDAAESRALASWQVFEDSAYPYGGGQGEDEQREPRVLASLRFDTDEKPDLVLLCHDRLLLYLSEKN